MVKLHRYLKAILWAKQRLSRLGFYRNFFYYVAIFVVAICIVFGIK